MNKRKPVDFTLLYQTLERLMGEGCPEKGAAVMAAEYLQARYLERKGLSPRNLQRM